ncbi:PocR ligand-binding domain-containing protein [Pseudodesulfovibrio sp.]|uniref:PocR ligand-binding domain-containing protein n=1 Tax=unclassified Pseudodesulfovibrio TaxID=2661612 RepID=UPI003B009BB1
MNLTDLAPEEKWRELQQDLHDRFGLNADIMDGEGHRLFGNTWGNDLCRAIRNDDKGFSSICVMAGQMFTQLLKEGEPFAEMCDAGMMRISVPVKKDGVVIGAVGGCGLQPADEEVDEFTIGMMSDLDKDAIPGLAGTVRSADEAKVTEIQDYISKRVAEIIG